MSPSVSSVPALVAAFFFGTVVNAAFAALALHVSSHGSNLLRDGQRLVLTTFLLSAALWALSDFLSIAIDTTAVTSCQVGVIFSTLFDQFARFSIEQFLVWAVNKGGKMGPQQMVIQGLVGIRFLLGAVFVGFSRPQFNPVCVPKSSVPAISIIVIALDAFFLAAVAVIAFTNGLGGGAHTATDAARGKAVVFVLVAFAIWTGTSIAMLLGESSITLLARTLVPAIGLLVLIVTVTVSNAVLTAEPTRVRQDLPSPGMRDLNRSESSSTDVSSYPPSRFEDVKRLDAGSKSVLSSLIKSNRGAGNMVISHPILEDMGAENPLNRIALTSLQDAAREDKDRRAMENQNSYTARAAVRPSTSNMPAEQDLVRSISLKRKDVAPTKPQPPLPNTSTLQAPATATTSSAQLSPSFEELRRRSPGQAPEDLTLKSTHNRATMMTTTTMSSPTIPASPTFGHLSRDDIDEMQLRVEMERIYQLQQAVYGDDQDAPPAPTETTQPHRQTIRPSRELSDAPKMPSTEPAKKLLPPRPSVGLPSNPRVNAKRPLARDAAPGLPQTVLFMKDIVYNDPQSVQNIIHDANVNTKRASVVQRPRPVPRWQDTDRAIFPAEPFQERRRSKSLGSLSVRKSIFLQSHPGSPTHLPPLPLPPTVTAPQDAHRPQPNDTKSMTFDDKMQLLYPPSPASATCSIVVFHRVSSVPDVPSVPRDFLNIPLSPIKLDSRMSASTSNTNRTSVKTETIFEVDKALPSTDSNSGGVQPSMAASSETPGGRDPSPPLSPSKRDSAITDARTLDDATTNWGSVHSPAFAVPIPSNRHVPRTTYINGRDQRAGDREEPLPATTFAPRTRDVSPPESVSSSSGEGESEASKAAPRWESRFGRRTLSFSERMERTRSQKMLPPTPLLLNNAKSASGNPIIVKAAPSPSPLESPGHALAYIQAQLKKYEEPNMAGSAAEEAKRLALLENLEKEIDLQAGRWRDVHDTMKHDSLSTMQTVSPGVDSRRQSARQSLNSSIFGFFSQPQRPARQPYMDNRSLGVPSFASFATTDLDQQQSYALGSPTPPDSDSEEAEWTIRQHRRRVESCDTVSISNFPVPPKPFVKTLKAVPSSYLWTPSQPKMATSSLLWTPASAPPPTVALASISEPVVSIPQTRKRSLAEGPLPIESAALWSKSETPEATGRGLWTATRSHISSQDKRRASLPEPQTRQVQEHKIDLDAVEPDYPRMSTSISKAPRPVTQRPQRRSRRNTVLPDILESPKPLPDKNDTLGIFQFPWGERSDTAELPVRNAPLAMPGTMASGGGQSSISLQVRAEQRDVTQYFSSFFEDDFDDYEDDGMNYESDEDDEDNEDNEDYEDGENDEADEESDGSYDKESDSDDGFDDNTLWEIASLLKTENIPSKLSLLPPPHPTSSGSDLDDTMIASSPEDNIDQFERSIADDDGVIMGLSLSNAIMDEEEQPQPIEPQLWTFKKKTHAKTPSIGEPGEETWMNYDTVSPAATLRSKQRKPVQPATVETNQLWNVPVKALPEITRPALWTDDKTVVQAETKATSMLWTARLPAKTATQSSARLFDLEAATAAKLASSVTRTTELDTIAREAPRKLRVFKATPLATLQSTSLWTATKQSKSLWVPRPALSKATTHKGLFDKHAAAAAKLAFAITRTTDLDVIALEAPRKLRSIKAEPLAALESTSLWMAAKPSKPSKSLWVPRPSLKASTHKGLFDKHVAAAAKMASAITRTTDRDVIALEAPRKLRLVKAEPLAALESTSLWMAAKPSKSLWAPRPVAKVAAHKGLFDKHVAAAVKLAFSVTRTTDLDTIALEAPRKMRAIKAAPLATLESANLWTAARQSKTLWAPRPVAKVTVHSGLFDKRIAEAAKLAVAVTRTTDLDVIALEAPRRLRTVKAAPLATLESRSLWASKQKQTKSLWVPRPAAMIPAQKGLFDKHAAAAAQLAVAVTRTTDMGVIALEAPRRLRAVKAAPLATLESTSLWSAKQSKSLWVPRPAAKVVAQKGLFDKHAAAAAMLATAVTRTTDRDVIALETPRRLRVAIKAAPLAVLESTRLWAAKQKQTKSLWVARPSAKVVAQKGLFDKRAAAAAQLATAVTRTSDLDVIALQAPRKLRTTPAAPLARLESTSLWTAKHFKSLWVPRPIAKITAPKGLFDKHAAAAARLAASVTCTTDLEPAALTMIRRPRALAVLPLDKLTSSRLWAAKTTVTPRMWAPMPVPEVQAKSHLFDREVAAVEKMQLPVRTTAMAPIQIARATRSLPQLPASRLESSSLWTTESGKAASSINWIMAQIPVEVEAEAETETAAPLLQRPVASSRDWAQALNEAVAASYPFDAAPEARLLQRPVASSREWAQALNEAVEASYPFDAARKHPAMASALSLESRSAAANDASKLHPVFF